MSLSSDILWDRRKIFLSFYETDRKQIGGAYFYRQPHCLSRVSADIIAALPRHDAGDVVTLDWFTVFARDQIPSRPLSTHLSFRDSLTIDS